jgi:hypothetical protein
MSVITDMHFPVHPEGKTVRGRGLGSRKLSKPARALLAADIAAGKVRLDDFSERQLSLLLGVSVPYIRAARGLDDVQRIAVEHGFRPLVVAPPRALPAPAKQLAQVVHQIGINATLDLLASAEQVTA